MCVKEGIKDLIALFVLKIVFFPLTSLMQALTYSNELQCCVEITMHFLYFLLLH